MTRLLVPDRIDTPQGRMRLLLPGDADFGVRTRVGAAEARDRLMDTLKHMRAGGVDPEMAIQGWVAPLSNPARGAGTAYNTSTTLTDVSPAPQVILPANYLTQGSALRTTATGIFSNTATPTLLLGTYYGGVAGVKLAAIGATTTTTAATNWPWRLEATTVVRTDGSAGTALTAGFVMLATALTAYSLIPMDAAAQTTATINTTAASAITLGAQWGTNAAANTLTCNQWLVETVV